MRSTARRLTAAVACTLALAACGAQPSGGSTAEEGATSPESATGIPDDFPLAAGMGGPEDTIPTTRTGTGLRSLELCGTSPLRGLGTRDRMVADNSGGEALATRELVLLGSPDEASHVAQAFSDLPSGCDRPAGTSGMETITHVRRSTFGPAPAAVLVQGYVFDGEPGPGHLVVHVVPVGAALLVTQTYGEWPDVADGIAGTTDVLMPVVDAMAAFVDEDDGDDGDDADDAAPIPGDFPLGVGLPEDDGETKVSPPSADGMSMGPVELCGQEVWPLLGTSGARHRLVTSALGPEYHDGRELIVDADAEAATRAMAVLRSAVETCHTDGNRVWTVLDHDTGHDTVTIGLTYARGLGSSVFQVTRVGSARVLVETYGEGSLASLDGQADGVTGTTEQIVPAMCVFTRTGC